MEKDNKLQSLFFTGATVFISSACVMIIELVAGRLIARHLGSSLYTWTSVIGVVLAGITVGNFLGGRIADSYPPKKSLAALFAISSAACVQIIVFNNLVGELVWLWQLDWPMRVFAHVSLVFLIPSILLGTISPVVAKMALDKGLPTGRTVGDIYACGAAGSIIGTFLAGFYLIAAMGTIAIIWTVGGVLLVMAVLYWSRLWILYAWAAVFIAFMAMGMMPADWAIAGKGGVILALRDRPDANVLYEDETHYCYVAVRRINQKPDIREFIQDKLKHSEISMESVKDLRYFYEKIYAAVTNSVAAGRDRLSVMVIGGGGYAYPRYMEEVFPKSNIEVVEIDPGVTKAAVMAFGLSEKTSIKTIQADARNYIDQLIRDRQKNGQKKQYDLIYEDAINDYSVPFQLVTLQFNEKISSLLADDGVYMVNLIDTYDSASFLGSVVNTLKKTFPFVYVATNRDMAAASRNTFVVAAAKRPIDLPKSIVEYDVGINTWCLDESNIKNLTQKAKGLVLTDDYVPVENLLAPVVCSGARETIAQRYLSHAEKLQKQGRSAESIEMYDLAIKADTAVSLLAYNEIGMIRMQQGDFRQAAETFHQAIDYRKRIGDSDETATIHLNLATALQKTGDSNGASEQCTLAAKKFLSQIAKTPDSPQLYVNLGYAYLTAGDIDSAADSFRKAVELDPNEPSYRNTLNSVLKRQGKTK